jgi:hypothetical protein
VARHARVGQKASDVNRAELPDLEGLSRQIVTIVTVDSQPSLTQQTQAIAFAVPLDGTLATCGICQYCPAFYPVHFLLAWRKCVLGKRDSECHALS